MLSLIQFFDPHLPLISLVGGGGKTTLLYALARQLRAAGQRVITTTTTHIFPPTPGQSPLYLLAPGAQDLDAALAQHGHVTVARELLPQGKLAGLTFDAVQALRAHQAVLLVEADGAAMRPLKAPAEHEPAVPPSTDICLALLGLGGVGLSVHEAVHRPERACALSGCTPADKVTPALLAHLALHGEGIFRTCPAGAQRGIVCILPQGMDREHGLALAHEAVQCARQLYPQSALPWWAGSALQGWVQRVLP